MKENTKYYGDMNFSSYVATARMARIAKMIKDAPHGMTSSQIEKIEGVCERTLRMYLTHLRNELCSIYIGGWVRVGTRKVDMVYMAGNKPDVRRPSVRLGDEFFISQNQMHLPRDHVSDDGAEDDILPVRRKAKNVQPHSDPLIDIFFGRLAA